MQLAHAAGCLRNQEKSLLNSPALLGSYGSCAGSHTVLTTEPKDCDMKLPVSLLQIAVQALHFEFFSLQPSGAHSVQPLSSLEFKSAFSKDVGGRK